MDNVQPAAVGTCLGCHQTTPIVGMTLSNDAANNRAVLHNNTDCDVDLLFNKISVGPHGGGDQSAVLSREQIQAWVDTEPDCQP